MVDDLSGETVGIVRVKHMGTPPDDSSPPRSEPLDGVVAHVRDIGWSLLIAYWDGVTLPDARRMDAWPDTVDGILIDEGGFPAPLLERLAARLPVVIIGGPADVPRHDVVTADIPAGAAAVITHLIAEHGRRRLFHLAGPANESGTSRRRVVLEQALRAHPGSRLAGTMHAPLSEEGGEQAARWILTSRSGQRPDAVVCASDRAAAGLLRAFARAGVRVPEDVAVAGYGGEDQGSLAGPLLTTVEQPRRLLGRRACARLIERIEAPCLPPSVELLRGDLVTRASCGCPPGASARRPVRPAHATDGRPLQ